MNIKIENVLNENKMVATVTLPKRKKAIDPVEVIRWYNVNEYIKENYVAPETHMLGECLTKTVVARNVLNSSHLTESWIYSLILKAPSKKTASKKIPSKKTAIKS